MAPQATPKGGLLAKAGSTGQMSLIATKCKMKFMYIARLAGQNRLSAVGARTQMNGGPIGVLYGGRSWLARKPVTAG